MCLNPTWLHDENQYEPCFNCEVCCDTFITPQVSYTERQMAIDEAHKLAEDELTREIDASLIGVDEDLPF